MEYTHLASQTICLGFTAHVFCDVKLVLMDLGTTCLATGHPIDKLGRENIGNIRGTCNRDAGVLAVSLQRHGCCNVTAFHQPCQESIATAAYQNKATCVNCGIYIVAKVMKQGVSGPTGTGR